MAHKRALTETYETTAQGTLLQPEASRTKRRKLDGGHWASTALQTVGQTAFDLAVYSVAFGWATLNLLKGTPGNYGDPDPSQEDTLRSPPPPPYEASCHQEADPKPAVHFALPPRSPKKRVALRKRPASMRPRRIPIASTFAPVPVDEPDEEADESFSSLNSTIAGLISSGQEALAATPERPYSFTFRPTSALAVTPPPRPSQSVAALLEQSASPSKKPWWDSA